MGQQQDSATTRKGAKDHPRFSAATLALKAETAAEAMPLLATLPLGKGYAMEAYGGADSLWVFLRRGKRGGIALRAAYMPGPAPEIKYAPNGKAGGEFCLVSALGTYRVTVEIPDCKEPILRCTTALTPAADLVLPYWPRDLFPINASGDPTAVSGEVIAAQRGLNSGLLYARLSEPDFGSFLYFQNLTYLNDYFEATGSRPDGVVGGNWPELGYKMPVSEDKPLAAGKEIVLSDVYLNFTAEQDGNKRNTARLFLELLAGVYRHLEKPASEFHPWPERARETLRDLEHSPQATVKEHGYTYLHPYTDAEYPDSMVQLTVLTVLREYARWQGEAVPFADELRKGVPNFFDIGLKTMRRYLPSVGTDKDADEVDSWYLYHPLINLSRLAREEGDEQARDLFLQSLPYAIKVAHRFEYAWPVQFNVITLEVIKAERKPGDPGQSDVGGLYAYAMLQAYEITGDALYLEEARAAIDATREMQFELAYQTNITAYGVTACLRLWRVTGDEFYKEQSGVFLAAYFHNCLFWESQIGDTRHFLNFLGATCLHDGPYMAPYECYESFAAFHEALEIAGDDAPESARLLLTEFCKYALSRAWYFYPDQLPPEMLATEIRNGQIDRTLAFPLEDLYADGQPAGQVGQEIYGSGAAFTFSSRAFSRLENAPFLVYSEYPLLCLKNGKNKVTFQVAGADGFTARLRLIPTTGKETPSLTLESEGGKSYTGHTTEEGHCEYTVPANQRFILH